LFPLLPAELRNQVYSYLDSSPATTHLVPLKLKTYNNISHTTVQICAVHHGNASLLALRKYGFLEGLEYTNHLLAHGLELWISIHFTAHMKMFTPKHWNDKISVSLRKLVRLHPWVKNVPSIKIKVLWEP
ncbi:hypothetical protein K504DRAFT_354617, partial [Pleomassaria siparia CBS 279.74]